MSQLPNATSDREAFTCSALLCLYLPGLSKKKPDGTDRNRQQMQEPDRPAAEQESRYVPGRAASFEKVECSTVLAASGDNIVFDFLEGEEEDRRGANVIQGYCPSPCFDLPMELLKAGKGCGIVTNVHTPVTAAFVFADDQRISLKKMASCLAGSEAQPPHLVRFLSASGCVPGVPRANFPSSSAVPEGAALEGIACEPMSPSAPCSHKPQVAKDGRTLRDGCLEAQSAS